jgi:glutamate-1-semialdehyde 2,1-aminomutase
MSGSAEEPRGVRRADGVLERARRVLPQDWPFGAVWAARHGDRPYPHFAESAAGSRFRDVAGNEHLDWFLGGGVVTLGHRHPAVQRALEEQLARGVHLSLPSALQVEVAERLVAMIPGAEQVAFGKNGSDVTSAAVRLARAVTGRERVVVSGYHGWQDWAKAVDPAIPGIPKALRERVDEVAYNDADGARELLGRVGREVAAIVVEPIRYADPDPRFLTALRELADRHGCLLVFDEVVTGLRVARGGAQELCGMRADLVCLAKSLANGLPLSALTGPRRLMRELPSIFFALTYEREALSLAAARATLDVHREHDVAGHLARIGERLRAGFAKLAADRGLLFGLEGHPALLHLRLAGGGRLTTRGAEALFVEACQRRGIYVQLHRLLPSFAHTEADVDQTLAAMGEAMDEVRDAMADGLAGRLDAPVWSGLEVAPVATPRASGRAPPLDPAPPEIRGARGATPFRSPADAAWQVESRDGAIRLALGRGGGQTPARVGLELGEVAAVPATVRARYRLVDREPDNAVVSVVLAAYGEQDGHFCEVRHTAAFGQAESSNASLGDRFVRRACSYGTRAGTLQLEIGADEVVAAHETSARERLGAVATSRQRWQLAFFLEVAGASAEVAVELLELSLDAPPAPAAGA